MSEIIILKNGVKLALERIPYVRTAALGIWVQAGTRHEPENLCGISHFIEHMVFKGSNKRTAKQIAEEMDGIGGQINAFTSMECTCFYARALDTHIQLAADVLCDIFFHAKFNEDDICLERGVVFEEIGMYQDSPEDLAVDQLTEAVFGGTPLGRPILGTRKTLNGFNHDILCTYRNEKYTPEATIVSVSGSFDDELIEYLKERFGSMPIGEKPKSDSAKYQRAIRVKQKENEQNHLCICFPSIPYTSDKRYAVRLLNSILGGGMSSRLFQKVREETGLCYSISTFVNAYQDTGIFNVYTALGKDTEEAALALIKNEIHSICSGDVTSEQLNRVREQFKANLLMGMENTSTRMNHQAQCLIQHGRIISVEELISGVDSVTTYDLQEIAAEILNFKNASFSGVGVLKSIDYYESYLK